MLIDLLKEKREAVEDKWLDLMIEAYPADSRKFFKDKNNRFANPVGATLRSGVTGMYEGLISGTFSEEAHACLENIVRIRAIQELSPSSALAFVTGLKKILREELEEDIAEGSFARELAELDRRIDRLGLHAFDIYMECREKTYKIRFNELKRRFGVLIDRYKIVLDGAEEEGATIIDSGTDT